MFFDLFSIGPGAHLKRASTMLLEARMANLEHQAAAEHHGALAHMYAERVQRLELQIYGARADIGVDGPRASSGEAASLYSVEGKRRTGLPTA